MNLRRSTTANAAPIRYLELNPSCEICGKHRGHDNHAKCSELRKAHYDRIKGRTA